MPHEWMRAYTVRSRTWRVQVEWQYNTGTATVTNYIEASPDKKYLGELAILLPANPTIEMFCEYLDTVDWDAFLTEARHRQRDGAYGS